MRMLFPESAGSLSPAGVADALAWPDGTDPCVRAIMVATADGSARSPKGLSAGISSAADRLVFGTLRGLSDVILAGACIIKEIMELTGLQELTVSDRGLRHGLLYKLFKA